MHRSTSELLELLYGVAERDEHLESCADCQGRLASLRARNRAVTSQPELPAEFLAAQRREIWKRIEKPSWRPGLMGPVPAAVATLVVIAGLFVWSPGNYSLSRPVYTDEMLLSDVAKEAETAWPRSLGPVSVKPVQADSTTDTLLFEEIERDLSGAGPRAAAPLRGLYSENN